VRKLLDVSHINSLGWQAKMPLKAGIEKTYEWYKSQLDIRKRQIEMLN